MTRELPPEELEGLKERGWRQIAAIDAALERGEIGEDGWHHAMADLIVPVYLAGDNPRETAASAWGFTIAGRTERAHPDTPELVRRAFWIDASPR